MNEKGLAINRCPTHDWWAITIEDEDGGIRVTPFKCCGRWDTVTAFRLSERDWRELAEIASNTADELAKQAPPQDTP